MNLQWQRSKSWFSFVKKLFVSEAKPKAEKKPKRWRCVFGRLKLKQYPALTAPQIRLSEAREEQRKHAVNVAIATAAAAEVVRLTDSKRLDMGNYSWGGKALTQKTRILMWFTMPQSMSL